MDNCAWARLVPTLLHVFRPCGPHPNQREARGTPPWPKDGLEGKCFVCACWARGLVGFCSACVWEAHVRRGGHGPRVESHRKCCNSEPSARDILCTLNSQMFSVWESTLSPSRSPLSLACLLSELLCHPLFWRRFWNGLQSQGEYSEIPFRPDGRGVHFACLGICRISGDLWF